ncbi:DNA polymerase III subunit delta [Anaerorhabdus sp.]|jgi:DNA polymerase III subunit delta|uniref:DNA polymerase III subunit delta n=1 Tax=Anaerorhabdus sp. TaxID=1872524 RepID=UPI002FC9F17A
MNYLIVGTEAYLIRKELNKIMLQGEIESNSMDTIFYDGQANDFSINPVLEDCNTPPFFNKKKTVIINNPVFLSAQKSLPENEVASLEKYLKNSSYDADLIFTGDVTLDKRKKIVKLLQTNARFMQLDRLSLQEFRSYVLKNLKENKIEITNDGRDELLDRLPNDLENFHSELDKMNLYGKQLDKEGVSRLISRPLDEDVFHLVNDVVSRNMKSALHLWNDLFVLNKDPIYLVALLASQFRLLYQVRTYLDMGYSEKDIQRELKVHPYRITKAIESLRGLTKDRCLYILNALAELDQSFKMGILDKKIGFEMFLIRTAR